MFRVAALHRNFDEAKKNLTRLREPGARFRVVPADPAGTVARSLGLRPHRFGDAKMAKGSQAAAKPFLSDIKTLRDRARKNIADGAVTPTYKGDPKQTVEILQSVLATEIVCVLRYTMHAVTATGIASDAVKEEFLEHAKEEQEHMMAVAERINQLGGEPNFNPEGLATRSASQYSGGPDLVDMIKENLVAERIAIDHYRELIRYFGEDDPTTKRMLEWILSVEEEHANDMSDLLAAQGASAG